MANEIRKDILLAIRSESQLGGVDAAMKKLADLQKVVDSINSGLKVDIGVSSSSIDAAAQGIRNVSKESKGAAATAENFTRKLQEEERALGTVAERIREIERVSKGGKSSLTQVFEGQGLSASYNQKTGAYTIAKDFTDTPEARVAAAQDEAIKLDAIRTKKIASATDAERDAAIREDAIRDRAIAARVDAERDSAIKLDAIRTKRIASATDAERDEAQALDVIFDKRVASREAKLRDSANVQDAIRTKRIAAETEAERQAETEQAALRERHLASFKEIAARPGVKQVQGPERIGGNGGLVQDTLLLDAQGNMIAKLNAETGKATGAVQNFNQAIDKGGDTLQSSAGKVLLWTLATNAVFGVLNQLRNSVTIFAATEEATVSLERVGRGFGTTFGQIESGARNVTSRILALKEAYGSSGTEAFQAAEAFAKLGFSQDQVIASTKAALQLGNLAGIGPAESARQLAAAMAQFEISAQGLPELVSKISIVEKDNRVSITDLLEAYSRAGGVVHDAGGSIEFFTAAVGVAAQATGRTGTEIGNAFKTIATNLGNAEVEAKIFQQTGIAIRNTAGDLKPIDDVLAELAIKFKFLTQAQKEDVAAAIAGARQKNIFLGIINNFAKVQDEVTNQFTKANTVEEENARILDELGKKYESLKAAFERFANAVGNAGVGSALKVVLDSVRLVIDAMTELGSAGVALAAIFGGTLLYGFLQSSGALNIIVRSCGPLKTALTASTSAAAALVEQLIALSATELGAGIAAGFTGIAAAATAAATAIAAFATSTAGIILIPLALAYAVGTAAEKLSGKSYRDDSVVNNADSQSKKSKAASDQSGVIDSNGKKFRDVELYLIELEKQQAAGISATNDQLIYRKAILEDIKNKADDAAKAQIESGSFGPKEAGELRQRNKESYRQSILDQIELQKKNIADNDKERATLADAVSGSGYDISTVSHSAGAGKEYDDLATRSDEARRKIQELQEQLAKPEFAEKAAASLEDVRHKLEQIHRAAKFESEIKIELATGAIEKGNAKLRGLYEELKLLKKEVEQTAPGSKERRNAQFAVEDKNIDIQETSKKIGVDFLKEELDRVTNRFKENFTRALNLRDKIADFTQDNGPEATRDVRKVDARIAAEKATIEQLKAAYAQSQNGAANETEEEKAVRLRAQHEIKNELIAAENRLEDRKAEKIEKELDAVKKISEERQRAVEAARRELSAMSDIDLVRARILAKDLQSGKQKPLSQADFLNLDQQNRQFLGKIDNVFPGLNLTPRLDLGFGSSAFNPRERERDRISPTQQSLITSLSGQIPGITAGAIGRGGELGASIQHATLNVQNVDGQPVSQYSKSVASPPAGALNLTISLGGLDVPADRIVNTIGLEVAARVQELVNNTIGRANRSIQAPFTQPVRAGAN